MYKGFLKDVEYVMGLFFKHVEDCCEKEDKDKDKKREYGRGCDCMPCCKEDNDDEEEDDDEADKKGFKGGILGPGSVTDIMKCLFDASDIDYDYED